MTARPIRASAAVAVLAGAVLLLAAPAGAAVCTFDQLTHTTGSPQSFSQPKISADGTHVAFQSNRNITGGNADGSVELVVVDQDGATTQVTDTATTGSANMRLNIDADGSRLTFVSDRDLVGDNADGNKEIFLWDATGPTTTQLTDTVGEVEGNDDPDIDADGSRVVFESDHDLTGDNPDLNIEIFLWDATGPTLTQITDTLPATGSFIPQIDDAGDTIAFTSNADIGGANPDGNAEVFRYEASGPTTTALTNTTLAGVFASIAISGDGQHVLFSSNRAFGGNNDANFEIWHKTVGGSLEQETVTTGGAFSGRPSITTDGQRSSFQSDAALAGNPAGENHAYVFDELGGAISEVDTQTHGLSPSVDGAGTHVPFNSNNDLTGDNGDFNQELFLATCGLGVPEFNDVGTGNVFFDQVQWMAAAEVASGFPDGTFHPQDPVKRQQMANFMYNLAGQPPFTPPVTPTFSDYPPSSTFYAQVEWMAAEGIASGFPDGTFRPQNAVKRQQMANFMYNLAGQPAFTPPVTPTFSDYPPSSTFYAQVEWMAAEGIASGFPDGTFRPQNAVKRQQMANFMYNFAANPGIDILP